MRADLLTIPAPWAVDRFGLAVAAELWVRIPTALAAAIARARSDRWARRSTYNDAVDDPRWPVPYEELGAHLRSVDGAAVARAGPTPYQVVVVRDHLLLPWCYGATGAISMRDVPPGGFSEMLATFAPWPRVLIAGYACTADHGLLRVCLGAAALAPGGLSWQHVEDLPLPPPSIPRPPRQRFP